MIKVYESPFTWIIRVLNAMRIIYLGKGDNTARNSQTRLRRGHIER